MNRPVRWLLWVVSVAVTALGGWVVGVTFGVAVVWQITSTWAALAGWAFFVTYWVIAPWWKSAIGWNLQLMGVALAAAFTAIAYRAWTGNSIEPMVWVTLGVLIAVTLTQRTVLLVIENRRPSEYHRRTTDHRDEVPHR